MSRQSTSTSSSLPRVLGTWELAVGAIALVAAASTLVSDFTGFFTLGGAYARWCVFAPVPAGVAEPAS